LVREPWIQATCNFFFGRGTQDLIM
jgi:hypothetical protein